MSANTDKNSKETAIWLPGVIDKLGMYWTGNTLIFECTLYALADEIVH